MSSVRELHTDGRYNRKPYRTKFQQEEAKADAVRCKDGAWRSTKPVSYHPPRKDNTGRN